MAKVGLLFPHKEMVQIADKIAEEQNIDLYIKK